MFAAEDERQKTYETPCADCDETCQRRCTPAICNRQVAAVRHSSTHRLAQALN